MLLEWTSGNKGKCIGFFLNKIVDELMAEEMWPYFKKHLVVLDLAALKNAIQIKGRKFLGLI